MLDHRHERVTTYGLSLIQLSLHRQPPSSATPLQISYCYPTLLIYTLPILGTCPKTVSARLKLIHITFHHGACNRHLCLEQLKDRTVKLSTMSLVL